MNASKDSIKSGRTVVGTTAGPNVDVSILADAGYDFLLFDTQHSAWEIKQLQPSIQTMRGTQAAPLVRVAANQAYQICFALDAGARGIVVPVVNTRAEAEAAVRACRYHPLGNRSNVGVRGDWGEFKNCSNWRTEARRSRACRAAPVAQRVRQPRSAPDGLGRGARMQRPRPHRGPCRRCLLRSPSAVPADAGPVLPWQGVAPQHRLPPDRPAPAARCS